jgi:hypothetical protein
MNKRLRLNAYPECKTQYEAMMKNIEVATIK